MILQAASETLLHSASDLTHFLACEALTALDLRALSDTELAKQKVPLDEGGQLVADKGMAHEKAHLQRLVDQGLRVVDINDDAGRDLAPRVQATQRAMASGAEVVYQATLMQDDLLGHADFLLKVARPSDLGDWSYEVADTKLALHAQAKFLVQLSFYSHLLRPLQGVLPEHMHVVLGDQSTSTFRCEDYTHYTQALLQRYRSTVQILQQQPQSSAYPLPCEHCDLCHWRQHCKQKRLNDDHLCQVAGIRKQQIIKLQDAGIHTMAALAQHPPQQRVPRMHADTLTTLQRQAHLQALSKVDGQLHLQVLPVAPGSRRGFERLPQPDPGDIYFDMEGDPLYPDGLEYLFGLWYRESGAWAFKPFWAHNRQEERQAFEACIDFIAERRIFHPDLHVYHYAHYEEHALKTLANAHGTRELEVDDMLRSHVLVDLYKVVREGLCISQPSYSIKYVEHFYRPAREGDVQNAGASIVNYERWRETADAKLLQDIEHYNRDDVQSTQQLHGWLLTLRPDHIPWFVKSAGSDDDSLSAATPQGQKARELTQRIDSTAQRLTAGLPEDPSTWTSEQEMRHLAAQLLGFYRRSQKPQWWNLFSKADLTEEELLEDPECLAGLIRDPNSVPVTVPSRGRYGPKMRYTFIAPEQESKIGHNDRVTLVHTCRGPFEIAFEESTRSVTLAVSAIDEPLPDVVHLGPEKPFVNTAGQEALFAFAEALLLGSPGFKAIQGILKREAPRIQGLQIGQPLVAPGQDPVQAAVHCALNLDQSYLYVQGPPGAGKTYTGSRMIAALLAAGRKVGVLSNSHKAINHLMLGALNAAKEQGVGVRAVKKSSGSGDSELVAPGFDVVNVTDNKDVLRQGGNLIGGTAWLFPNMVDELDTLFVDEAGQVALANLVACSGAARNIVLLGDQMQLGQPVQGVHPGHSGDSTLDYLLNGAATIAPDRGIFLPTSWRMHPDMCGFISQAIYEGRLQPEPGNAKRTLVLDATAHSALKPSGIGFVPVKHQGCSQQSQAEANLICQIYQSALQQHYTTAQGQVLRMTPHNILVVVPYNLQVKLLQRLLPAGARVGTVDKFQGQEAELVLVSMTTSSQEDLPRHVEFLYSKNRLNVALSRAKCTALLVVNPALLAIKCKQPGEMALVNTLCWVGEWAGV